MAHPPLEVLTIEFLSFEMAEMYFAFLGSNQPQTMVLVRAEGDPD